MWKNVEDNWSQEDASDAFDRQPTLFSWMVENLSDDDLRVIRERGVAGGISGLATPHQTAELFDRLSDIEDKALALGLLSMPDVQAARDADSVKHLLVWAVAQHYANDPDLNRLVESRCNEAEEGKE